MNYFPWYVHYFGLGQTSGFVRNISGIKERGKTSGDGGAAGNVRNSRSTSSCKVAAVFFWVGVALGAGTKLPVVKGCSGGESKKTDNSNARKSMPDN